MFPSIKRTINFEVVKTPPSKEAEPKHPLTYEEQLKLNAMLIVNAKYAAYGIVGVYAAIKAIDTASKIAIIRAGARG